MVDKSEYCIRYVEMPYKINAFTVKADGFYNIYVNTRHSCEQNKQSILHELEHINNGDFDCFDCVDIIEKIRHCV